jgi:tetratricopeptide (TPR) repeat protein
LLADASLASGNEGQAIADIGAARDAYVSHAFAHGPSDARAEEIAERLRAVNLSLFLDMADSTMRDWPAPDQDRIEALLGRMKLKSESSILIRRAGILLERSREAEAAAALEEAARLPLSRGELEMIFDLSFRLIGQEEKNSAEAPPGGRPRKSLELDVRLARDILARVGALREENIDGEDPLSHKIRLGEDETRLMIVEARSLALLGRTIDARKTLAAAELQAVEPSRLCAIALSFQDDLKDYPSALRIFGRLAREYPRETSYRSSRGLEEYLAGDAGRAIGTLTAVIDAAPAELPAYLTLGAIYEKLGRIADAEAVYQSALSHSRDGGPDGPRRLIEESLRELEAKKKP